MDIHRDPPGQIWPVIAISLGVFLVWSEQGSQDCVDQTCHLRVQAIGTGDSKEQAINKISAAVNNQHTLVNWRRSMLGAIIAAAILLVLSSLPWGRPLPSGRAMLLVSAVFFIVFYFFATWEQNRRYAPCDDAIEHLLRQL